MLEPLDVLITFQIACVSYVVATVLIAGGGLLEPWLDVLVWLRQSGKFGDYISKPLGMCYKCLAGQAALWVYLLMIIDYNAQPPAFILLRLATAISITIIFTTILNKLLK